MEGVDSRLTLKHILEGSTEKADEALDRLATQDSEETAHRASSSSSSLCVECEDTPSSVACEQCRDTFCDLCFKSLHRKGFRQQHRAARLSSAPVPSKSEPTKREVTDADLDFDGIDSMETDEDEQTVIQTDVAARARYIPVRLTLTERKLLRLLEAALHVSEYTDRVDILSFKSKGQRIHQQLQEMCSILCGLVVATDYKAGQDLIQSKEFRDNAQFFQRVFEIGRRHKIMNPEKMRTEYGKLIYLCMDSVIPEVETMMGFACVKPVLTVHTVLEEGGAGQLLNDPLVHTATSEVVASRDKPRHQIQKEIKQKEAAIEILARKYSNSELEPETIKQCLYSISDNNSFLHFNRVPVDKMLRYLETYFDSSSLEPGYSLAINSGMEGARLTHNHERQYIFVHQSLTLWREVLHDMFKLWCLAEEDMLERENPYRLKDTGQGLNRVQDAPRVHKTMYKVLQTTQNKLGGWVGSSVIHLGDHNVPNALMFIDKYTQVPRILAPIVLTLEQLDVIVEGNAGIRKYVQESFGGLETAKKTILVDFFRHAFDGSGADNFFDAGSCIDGRLTSAWNWCSKLERKPYYPLFKLTGFNGFDGDFQK